MLSNILNKLEDFIRFIVIFITNYLPVKVIRDDKGRPFLYRYHIFAFTNDGPGICIHNFVKSDPDRGYHDHPWKKAVSFILSGGYNERIYNPDSDKGYDTFRRKRWTFNPINGEEDFHRVMLGENEDDRYPDAWTIFFFQKRSKTWNMIGLDGVKRQMSTTVHDLDGGWWNHVLKGISLHKRLNNIGNVIATVDIVVIAENKILLIKRGKAPYKDHWALPGGRIEETDENILEAAKRELLEETGIKDDDLNYIRTIGDNTRDERGFCITNIFHTEYDEIPENVKAGDDAIDFMWCDIDKIDDIELAFDHLDILNDVL